MSKRKIKAFVLADSLVGLLIVSMGLATFTMVRQQCLAQEKLAVQRVQLAPRF